MTLRILIFALALTAIHAQEPPLGWTSVSASTTEVCTVVSGAGHIDVAPGKETECWRLIVQAHNKAMNDDKYHHETLDPILYLAADQFGKKIVKCAVKKSVEASK